MDANLVLILDYGSQYTHLITRRIRSLSVNSLCVSGTSPLSAITALSPRVIILSGGPNSVHDSDAPCFPDGFLDYIRRSGVFVLGICYGMQLLVHKLGGVVAAGEKQDYGQTVIHVDKVATGGLFGNKCVGDKQKVLMSHTDVAVLLPEGFDAVAHSEKGAISAIEDRQRRLYGLQYHPEVTDTPQGIETLGYFLFEICGVDANWKVEDVMDEELRTIESTVAPDEHVICALSGGVDSAVAATLVHKAIGDRLHCVFVDNGLLRYREQERVMETFKKDLHLPVTCIDATERFLGELRGVSDPKQKRMIIGKVFIDVFNDFADELERKLGKKPVYLVQGTLYPDVIESCPRPGSGRNHSHTIKNHHNVGGLPKDMKFKLIEPLRNLFKDEVRAMGKILKVPDSFLKRHPFPGPGLALRILEDVTEGNLLDMVRQADEIFIEAIKEAGLYDTIWQAFVVLLPVLTVGVQGDQGTYGRILVLRAVTTEDGMTANAYIFTEEFLTEVERKIRNNVRGVVRVLPDLSPKPPATIEYI